MNLAFELLGTVYSVDMSGDTAAFAALLVVFQVKHWLCDFPLQTPYMLGKGKTDTDWVNPLTAHAGVHALGTFIVAACFLWGEPRIGLFAVLPACFDFWSHFVIDRIKAAPSLGGRWKPSDPKFWWALGADQAAHHLVGFGIIFYLLMLRADG